MDSRTAENSSGNGSDGKARVFVVDDHPLIRQGLIQLISSQPDLELCGEAGDSTAALEAIRKLKPDLAIVDLSLGEESGIDLIRDLKAVHSGISVLVLSMHDETYYAERAMRAGASGYIMKGGALDEVMSAVRRIMKGGVHFSEKISAKILQRMVGGQPSENATPVDALSDREMSVFELIGEGLGPNEIARKLHLSVKTIETYRSKIKIKLDIADASTLRQYAIQWAQTCRGL